MNLLTADDGHVHLPYAKTMELLQSIKVEAIVLGTGKTEVYVFVDPLCPHSRKFMTMVSGNGAMLTKYKYYIFLYTIPRLKSEAVVEAIYASKDPVSTMLDIMVEKQEPVLGARSAQADKTVSDIASVALEMDVYKRPYIIVAGQE